MTLESLATLALTKLPSEALGAFSALFSLNLRREAVLEGLYQA